MSMTEQNNIEVKLLRKKLDPYIEEGWKTYPGGAEGEYRFAVTMPADMWDRMCEGTLCRTGVGIRHFLYRGEMVISGHNYGVIKL